MNGQRYLMDTGEEVEVGLTRYFVTPAGDVPLVSLRIVRDHTFRGTRELDNGRVIREDTQVRRGTYYSLMPSEIERNGIRLGA